MMLLRPIWMLVRAALIIAIVLTALVYLNVFQAAYFKESTTRAAWSEPEEAISAAVKSIEAGQPIDYSKPGYSPEQREFLREVAAIDEQRVELEASLPPDQLEEFENRLEQDNSSNR